ncbi:MAG: hypothetical protein AABY32_00175 [Nanoarchaeota archaeon]
MGSTQTFTLENFPIEPGLCNSSYSAISRAMYSRYSRDLPGIRESGLYGTHAFYNPKADEILPVLFGTLYSGTEYAEVLFYQAQNQSKGKLEVKLFGEDEKRLLEIKNNIQFRLNNILESRKNG